MKNKRFRFKIVNFIYIALIVYVGYIFIQQQGYLTECKRQENMYYAEIQKNKQIAASLEQQKEYYQTNEYIEKTAREKLGMVVPGEKIYVDVSQ